MIESTADEYQSSKYAKALAVAEAKVGKSSYLIASALGVLPWQQYGGIVDSPRNLHVITFDANALGGIAKFLTETCGAPAEALKFNVYNMQDDVRAVSKMGSDWDYTLYNTFNEVVNKVGSKARGVPMVLVSSLTGLAQGLERALAGPPGVKARGAGMDQSKWAAYAHWLSEIRNLVQQDDWHCWWEGHIYKPPATGQNQESRPETLQISGKSGQNFAYNVEQVFRIRRRFGLKYKTSRVEETYLDTAPTLDFISGGRSFTESLKEKEADPTTVSAKLGLKVGQWNNRSGKSLKAGGSSSKKRSQQ